MNWRASKTGLGLLLALSLTSAAPANAGECRERMGPYLTGNAAAVAAQRYRYAGYQTSGVWGEGGIIRRWSERRYYFNLFFPC